MRLLPVFLIQIKKEYARYKKMEKVIEEKRKSANEQLAQMESTKLLVMEALDLVDKSLDGKALNEENINAIEAGGNRSLVVGKSIVSDALSKGGDFETLEG